MATNQIEQTGIEAILEQEKKEIAAHSKTITIRTTRFPNRDRDARFFPKDLNYQQHASEIEFSHPLIDYRGIQHKKLTLVTTWFSPEHAYWNQWLNDERGFVFITKKEHFPNQLDEPFMNYSEQRLREWQEQGFNAHEETLDRLNRLYYQLGVAIPEDLLE